MSPIATGFGRSWPIWSGGDRRPDLPVETSMDRLMLENHLAEAMRHVREGERRVARQRQIVAELEKDSLEGAATQAKRLLQEFEKLQAAHIADRDRLLAQVLAPEAPWPPGYARHTAHLAPDE
jgi:hypothetical protein